MKLNCKIYFVVLVLNISLSSQEPSEYEDSAITSEYIERNAKLPKNMVSIFSKIESAESLTPEESKDFEQYIPNAIKKIDEFIDNVTRYQQDIAASATNVTPNLHKYVNAMIEKKIPIDVEQETERAQKTYKMFNDKLSFLERTLDSAKELRKRFDLVKEKFSKNNDTIAVAERAMTILNDHYNKMSIGAKILDKLKYAGEYLKSKFTGKDISSFKNRSINAKRKGLEKSLKNLRAGDQNEVLKYNDPDYLKIFSPIEDVHI